MSKFTRGEMCRVAVRQSSVLASLQIALEVYLLGLICAFGFITEAKQ